MMINETDQWQASANIQTLKQRAKILQKIRNFFDQRDCFEVMTPTLSQFGNTEPNIQSFVVSDFLGSLGYLNTSPEFHMKRLLASGSGAIYQICPAYRNEDQSSKHNPEFTMLEWYRPDWNLEQLMEELILMLHEFFNTMKVNVRTYQQALLDFTDVDCFVDDIEVIEQKAQQLLGQIPLGLSKDELLDLLFSFCVEPKLGQEGWCFITQYPASQASLAKKAKDKQGNEIALRFELYHQGLELANGYWELTNWQEQLARFEHDNKIRAEQKLQEVKIDHHLIDALKSGMPDCAGVAVGIDRICMLALKQEQIKDVLCFKAQRA